MPMSWRAQIAVYFRRAQTAVYFQVKLFEDASPTCVNFVCSGALRT